MTKDDAVVALGWNAQHQAQQLLQSQRYHKQLYESLMVADASGVISECAMLAQRQQAPTTSISVAAPDDRPVKKNPAIWSPAADIENNNNNKAGFSNNISGAAEKWKRDVDQTKMRYCR